jgi:hypothetical protein
MADEQAPESETPSMSFEVWHTESGNLVHKAATLSSALQFVLAQGAAAAARFALIQFRSGESSIVYARGAALYAIALAESLPPPKHRVMIISEPLRGRDAESIAVDLLKRVFLDGQLQLISVEVLRQTEEGSDDWDNVLVSDQTGDLWMQAVERFRAERKAEREAGDTGATGKEPS